MPDVTASPTALAGPTAPTRPPARISNTLAMVTRSVRLSTRNVDALLTSVILPVMIMLLFVYLFGGAIETGTAAYVNYVLPGVLLLCTGFVSALTAAGVTQDMEGGIIDRFRSMDVSGAAMLSGHVAASVVRNATSTAVTVAVALLIGFRPTATATEWLAAIGLLVMFVLAVSWVAAAFGLLARTPEGASGFSFFVMFLPYPSSAFVPIDTMPTWLHGFAEHQPATPLEWLAAIGVLLMFVLTVSWVAAAFGLLARTPEGAGGFSFFVMFLPYPSSAFVPIETMPTWLHGFAEHQPATPVIETLRGLLLGTPIGDGAALAIAWCAGITALALTATGVLFRRRTA